MTANTGFTVLSCGQCVTIWCTWNCVFTERLTLPWQAELAWWWLSSLYLELPAELTSPWCLVVLQPYSDLLGETTVVYKQCQLCSNCSCFVLKCEKGKHVSGPERKLLHWEKYLYIILWVPNNVCNATSTVVAFFLSVFLPWGEVKLRSSSCNFYTLVLWGFCCSSIHKLFLFHWLVISLLRNFASVRKTETYNS